MCCDSLRSVEFYEVGKISYHAFENYGEKGCGLKSVTFNGPVSIVCKDAFKGNSELEQVIGFDNIQEIELIHGEKPDIFTETPLAGKFI